MQASRDNQRMLTRFRANICRRSLFLRAAKVESPDSCEGFAEELQRGCNPSSSGKPLGTAAEEMSAVGLGLPNVMQSQSQCSIGTSFPRKLTVTQLCPLVQKMFGTASKPLPVGSNANQSLTPVLVLSPACRLMRSDRTSHRRCRKVSTQLSSVNQRLSTFEAPLGEIAAHSRSGLV